MQPSREVKVWDPFVRIGHWAVVLTFLIAYFTGDELLDVHVWAGYVVAGYVIARIVWGFTGSKHARFTDFAYGPVKAARYLIDLARSRAPRYLGHSPAGAVMVFALLSALAGTVSTGMIELARDRGEGPLGLIVERRPDAPYKLEADRAKAQESERESDEEQESPLLELHELLANLTLILVILHIGGVALASWSHKESLVKAMLTGRKRDDG